MPSTTPRRGSPRLRKILKELHHQTWELELLVSGLVTFALIQLPGPLDHIQRLSWVRSGEGMNLLALLGMAYFKLALYTLLVAFVFHLVVRAFWVGLVGLDSVFPGGVREQRVEGGPITRELVRDWIPSIRQLMVRTDAIASVIFAAAFAMVVVLVSAIPVFLGMLVVGLGVASLLPGRVTAMPVFWVAWVLFMLFAVVLPLLERTLAPKLDREGRLYGFLRAAMKSLYLVSGYKAYGPVFHTLGTRLGTRRISIALFTVLMSVGVFMFVRDLTYIRGRLQIAGSPWTIDAAGPAFADPNFYEDRRSETRSRLDYPSIPSEVVTSPFLRLFLPYRPIVFDRELERHCPQLEPSGRSRIRTVRSPQPDSTGSAARENAEEIRACMAQLFELELDGEALPRDPVTTQDARTGVFGLLYMIPMESVADGQHLLTVRGPVRPAGDPEADDAPLREYQILLWRGRTGND